MSYPFAYYLFNADAAKPGLQKAATPLGLLRSEGEPLRTMVINAIEAILSELRIPRRLRNVGVPREALSDIAASAMGDWFLRGNPRPVHGISELQQEAAKRIVGLCAGCSAHSRRLRTCIAGITCALAVGSRLRYNHVVLTFHFRLRESMSQNG